MNKTHYLADQEIEHLTAKKFFTATVEDMIPRVVQRILEYAAENVEVLELACPHFNEGDFDIRHPISLPRLRELTIYGNCPLGREGHLVT